MDTISIFLRIFFENIEFILPVAGVFLIVTFVGVNMVLAVLKEERWSLILPLGAATGLFSFIILLGTISYIFKARVGIFVIFAIFVIFGFFLFRKNRTRLPRWKIGRFVITSAPIYFLITGLVVFLAGTTQYGGDVIAYWGFATSFANGNYPLRSPWQPDLLANHHQGTYLFEGAVHALTDVDMLLIHTMYSIYVVLAGFFLIWAIVRKMSNRDFLSIIPALTVYFSFGAIFVPFASSFRRFFNPEVEHIVNRLPILLDAKNRLGGMSNLPDMIYINHRAAALLGFLLILYIIFTKLKVESYFKPVIISALSIAIISSDEIYLPAIIFAVIFWFVRDLLVKEKERKKTLLNFILAGIIFIILFIAVGSALRDSILTPPKGETRFQLVFNEDSFLKRSGSFRSAILLLSKNTEIFWILPSVWFIATVALFLGITSSNILVWLLMISTIGSMFAFFTVEHTYYTTNNERFLSQIYQHLALIISVSSVIILSKKAKAIRTFSYFCLFFLLVPSIIFSTIFIYKYAKKPAYNNLYGKISDDRVLMWLRTNLPKERVFFIDGFLWKTNDPYLTNHGIQNFGLFVPVSPANIKVHTPDFGIEAIDVINTLNPSQMKALKVSYIYILNTEFTRYPEKRQNDLVNKKYFKETYKDDIGVLYEITDEYYNDGKDLSGTISELSEKISGGNIYIDNPPTLNFYVRSALSLALKDNGNLYSVWGPGIFNYIETKITLNQPEERKKYDFLILGPETDPKQICNCSKYEKIWEIKQAVAYEVK